ncbi:MAG TPA: hypothetical protein DCR50_14760 [Afipia sp.]|nr:hypothetical protein [Afipia sp.]HBF53955.1 hypothetical protein [Afipia sp.]
MGPAPMMRIVEMSVLLGIKSHGQEAEQEFGHKKRARVRASFEPGAWGAMRAGVSLDQIPER